MAGLYARCQQMTWPHLKNSTRGHYKFYFSAVGHDEAAQVDGRASGVVQLVSSAPGAQDNPSDACVTSRCIESGDRLVECVQH